MYRVAAAMRLKVLGSYLTWKVASKYVNSRERVKVVERNNKPSLSLLSCDLSVSMKENPDRKKRNPWHISGHCGSLFRIYRIKKEYRNSNVIKVLPGPLPAQSLKVGPQDPLQSLKVEPWKLHHFLTNSFFFRIFFLFFFICFFSSFLNNKHYNFRAYLVS